jgi:hypothetical protein
VVGVGALVVVVVVVAALVVVAVVGDGDSVVVLDGAKVVSASPAVHDAINSRAPKTRKRRRI